MNQEPVDSIRKTKTGYVFPSERALEDFLWRKGLWDLFGFLPVGRQVRLDEEPCDIVAATTEGRPVLIELKNERERHVVSQITRYYDAFLQKKPFAGKLNYDLQPRLLVLSPDFHRHNQIDRAYSRLPIEFHRHEIVVSEERLLLRVTDIDLDVVVTAPLMVSRKDDDKASVATSAKLQKWLSTCSPVLERRILELRAAVLASDERNREIPVGANVLLYGRSKTSPVAEIRYNALSGEPVVFLWLPDGPLTGMLTNRRQKSGRIRLWFQNDDVSHLGYVKEGLGKMKLYKDFVKNLKVKSNFGGENGGDIWIQKDNGGDGRMRISATGDRSSHLPLLIDKYLERNKATRRPTIIETLVEIALSVQ